jgi:arylsulfatase A-like enzyme
VERKGDVAQDFDGISLVPVLKDPGADLKRDTLYWHYPHYYPTTSPVSSILRGNWKLLEYFEDGHLELYNLAEDPGEEKNLAEKLPQTTGELRSQLRAWRESVDAQLPEVNKR